MGRPVTWGTTSFHAVLVYVCAPASSQGLDCVVMARCSSIFMFVCEEGWPCIGTQLSSKPFLLANVMFAVYQCFCFWWVNVFALVLETLHCQYWNCYRKDYSGVHDGGEQLWKYYNTVIIHVSGTFAQMVMLMLVIKHAYTWNGCKFICLVQYNSSHL